MLTRASQHRAFTLIEVLIVVLILGILATFSIPQFETMRIKAKFAQALVIASRFEREVEYLTLEDGWDSFSPQANLRAILVEECGLVSLDGFYYVDNGGVFAYSTQNDARFSIYTRQPTIQALCTRYYLEPGSFEAECWAEKFWWGYTANPYYNIIKPMLKGTLFEQ